MPVCEPLLAWYDAVRRDLPWRHTRDPYRIWLSEIMLQQTRTETVKSYYNRFLVLFPTVADLAHAPQEQVLKAWEGLGYYSRARNLQKAAQVIMSVHGGAFPTNYEGLLSLPGVGPYTAGAIGSIAFGLRIPAVDGNVLRLAARLTGWKIDVKDYSTAEKLGLLAYENEGEEAEGEEAAAGTDETKSAEVAAEEIGKTEE